MKEKLEDYLKVYERELINYYKRKNENINNSSTYSYYLGVIDNLETIISDLKRLIE